MTDPSDLGYEQPEADVLDQRRTQAPDEPVLEPFELPAEADEADLLEQHRVVPADEDES
ncbi:hypothetical protein [Actinophytocola sp.]|uniref:hypothetical protein n=1 Tax=Actinophytocola sp. TaxID=1872138 RepID=UPI002D7EA47F|nr:hypothetical protein [Actinophytocola sp.]HET9139882.1 hypothetical protein [Actinophytocola sp.]